MNVNLNPNEVVIKAGNSNHNNCNGKLIITNQRIIFYKDNNIIDIIFDNIKEVIFYSHNIFKKGLNIVTNNNQNYKFIVKDRDEFGKLINKMY